MTGSPLLIHKTPCILEKNTRSFVNDPRGWEGEGEHLEFFTVAVTAVNPPHCLKFTAMGGLCDVNYYSNQKPVEYGIHIIRGTL